MASAKKRPHGQWIDDIHAAVGNFIRVETSEGLERSGRLTAIRTRLIKFNDQDQQIPVELELNGDPTDTIPVSRLVVISIGT